MGIRQRGYWLRQADAIRRQFIADIGYGVRIGMADSGDYQKAIDKLELSEPKRDLRDNLFEIMGVFNRGRGKNV